VWKWKNADPDETLGINKKCVEVRGISGKISMLSTMGDSDDYAMAIKAGIKVWGESNPTVRDKNGRTISGLLRAFVGAEHSKVLPAHFTDKFGKVDLGRAQEYIYNDRAKYPKGSKTYTFECRRMPLTAEEALSSADTSAVYPTERLQRRLDHLAGLLPEAQCVQRMRIVRCGWLLSSSVPWSTTSGRWSRWRKSFTTMILLPC
jgi:hypothetical protein